MIPNNYKTSLRIPSQLPEFIRDDVNYETFVSFVEAYYEWLELANTANANTTIASTSGEGVTYASKNLSNYSDIDSTLDGFLKYYINDFLPYFPEDALADKAKVLKIAKQLYQAKGTPASFRLLFRLLYNSSAEILMTGDLVFRASAGNWYVPKYLKIRGDISLWLTAGMESYRVFGISSKSFATIEKVILNGTKCDVYISNIQRLFESGEEVIVVDSNNQNIYVKDGEISTESIVGSETVTGKIVGALSTISIDPKFRGLTYNVGDPVVVYGGLTSNSAPSATAEVSEVTKGSIQRINTLDGGFGYIPGEATINFATFSNTTIQFLNNGGALASVGTFDTTAGSNSTINTIITDRISVKQNILLSNANYFFSNSNTTSSVNTNTRLVDAFTYYETIGYPISSVIVDNGGGGFSQLPIAIAKTHFYDIDTGGIHDLDDIGQLAPIEIIQGGLGYKANDRITITGGQGQGASANVKTVDASGSITSVEYVPFENFSTIYPIGGTGYNINDILGTIAHGSLSANPSSNVLVSSITQGKFPLWDTVYQTFDTYANSFFTATVNGIDTTNMALKVYNVEGTLNDTQPLISLANTQNTVTVTSNSISGIAAELFIPGILGAGAEFQLTTDRIGSVTKIKITDAGEDYISNPSVSLRVQDLCVNSVTGIDFITPGTLLFQGQDANNSIYRAYVDKITVVNEAGSVANNTYNLRVYNYVNTPSLYNLNNSANTILQVSDEVNGNPTMILTTVEDIRLGYSNGVKTYGDGNARASSKFLNGLIFGQGIYLDTKGQPSSFSVLQSRNYNDYTYVLSVEQPISKYRQILKNLLHPAGMKVIGRDLLNSQKAFAVKHDSGTSIIKPLQYWADWPVGNPYAYVTMNVSGIIANSMIRVTNGGTGYSPSTTVSIDAIDGRGTGATAVANIANGVIVSIDVTAPGSDYILSPDIIISDPTTRGGNSNASVTVSVDLSSNVMIIQNMNGGGLEPITQNTHWITVYPEQIGGNCKVYSNTKEYDDANSIIILEDDTFFTFPNVIYGYANTSNLAISISDISVTNTPVYDIINNGNYSNTENHLEDIIFAGDNLTVAGNTYVIQSVDYNAHLIYVINARAVLDAQDGNQILTEDGPPGNSNNISVGAYTLSFGSPENPLPMTINRSISTGNVFIKALI
jgi:hypothetical protein